MLVTSALAELRSVTNDVHERLHNHPVLSCLTKSDLTLRDYMWTLFAFERFYHNIFIALDCSDFGFFDSKYRLINKDLKALRFKENPLPKCQYLQYEGVPDQILGVKYVMIGSSLGGALISKNIEKQLHLNQDNGNSFFGSSPKKIGIGWNSFLETLEQECKHVQRCTDAALKTFEGLEQWLWDVSAYREKGDGNEIVSK